MLKRLNEHGVLSFLFLCLWALIITFGLSALAYTIVNRNNPVVVEPTDILEYRPIRALGDGWYLVEIKQAYQYDDLLPFGNRKVIIVIPHIVRMKGSELPRS